MMRPLKSLVRGFLLLSTIIIPAVISSDDDTIPNPYIAGCLRETLPGWTNVRVCGSDDDPSLMEQGICRPAEFEEYMEIRISVANWDSPVILTWLIQIILSEILGVPASVETGRPHHLEHRGLYDPMVSPVTTAASSGLDYTNTTSSHTDVLVVASDLLQNQGTADCRVVNDDDKTDEYTACAHVIPEYWDANSLEAQELIFANKIEPAQTTGFLGHESWFVTKFTADDDPTLVSYRGLMGEANRQKMADMFLRPTTWRDYCLEVSPNNCRLSDDVAQRAPSTEDEDDRMFVPGLYTGHFRATDDNNCTLNPTTCTGHIGNYPCGWTSHVEQSLYHLNIPLKSDGMEGVDETGNGKGGYTSSQLADMWHAANATKSNLIMFWWTPQPLYYRYLGSDAEMQRILLPPVTQACVEARTTAADECSLNQTVRAGDPKGACDNAPHELHKLITGALQQVIQSENIPAAIRSPAYDMLRIFQVTDAQLGDISQLWQQPDISPRQAVCRWAADNLDILYHSVPTSYPRVARLDNELSGFGIAMTVLGAITTILVLVTAFFVYKRRNKLAVRYAQVEFVWLLLCGSFLIAIGAILTSLPATDGTCVATVWFINIGYTLELVPLIVKVAAINEMLNAASRLRRVTLTHKSLFGAVAVISVLCCVFLTIWTVLDSPNKKAVYDLTGETTTTDAGVQEHIVGKSYYCSRGESDAWQFSAVAWNAVMLFSATVLAFQTRNVQQSFNESRTLAFLIYSHFVFVILRICTFLLVDSISGTTLDQLRSLLYSLDTIFTIAIYIFPKLIAKDSDMRPSLGSAHISGMVDLVHSAQFSINGCASGNSAGPYGDASSLGYASDLDVSPSADPSSRKPAKEQAGREEPYTEEDTRSDGDKENNNLGENAADIVIYDDDIMDSKSYADDIIKQVDC
ncbi:Gamma-aminobutyric acid (GABA) B receptor [Seminavis robusta]|uniref:Gamma-aminobutyric acid (GABA) B receptor n=1 Tax=Seminavis robusta TaxID=568900 RepID=A0A9N8E7N6_9STRA|nr:Gamma-aminobutyric acid (GABA) B receptor [Seminavis robusta]|eukprot:Sro631_g178580.1 Gamma-aminobutyric acid (GABA) B receptor (917) ;mRNA; r:47667-50514